MKLEMPKLNRDEALALARKMPFLEKTPEEIVENWEKFAQEIPVGTEVTNTRDPISRGVTMAGRYYDNPFDNYLSINVKNILKGTWRVVDTVKAEMPE